MHRLVLRFGLALFLVLGWAAPHGIAQQYLGDKGKAVFTSETPLTTFDGTSEHLTGLLDFDKNLVDFFLDLNTLDTGIGLRDKHMRKNYLETDKYPFAEFTGKILNYQQPPSQSQEVTVTGTFKIHGVSKEVQIKGMLIPENGGFRIQAQWDLMLKDYNIDIPKVVFYQLSEKQAIRIDILLKPYEQ
jgi:polyisoprenoid-binding protein YceI